jgi:flagellar motor switch protein FliG
VVNLDNKSIQRILRDVDAKDLGLALKTSSEELKELILKNMSKRAAEMLVEDMQMMGPVRLHDVEEAQQKIVNTIRQLEDSGEIIIARGKEDTMIV